jgi:hypothetical protein
VHLQRQYGWMNTKRVDTVWPPRLRKAFTGPLSVFVAAERRVKNRSE